MLFGGDDDLIGWCRAFRESGRNRTLERVFRLRDPSRFVFNLRPCHICCRCFSKGFVVLLLSCYHARLPQPGVANAHHRTRQAPCCADPSRRSAGSSVPWRCAVQRRLLRRAERESRVCGCRSEQDGTIHGDARARSVSRRARGERADHLRPPRKRRPSTYGLAASPRFVSPLIPAYGDV